MARRVGASSAARVKRARRAADRSQVKGATEADSLDGVPSALREAERVTRGLLSAPGPAAGAYATVLEQAVTLVSASAGSIRVRDPADPAWMVTMAHHGAAPAPERWRSRAPISEGVSGRVLMTSKIVEVWGGGDLTFGSKIAPPGTQAALGLPLRKHGEVFGSLVVATTTEGRRFRGEERELLSAVLWEAAATLAHLDALEQANRAVTDPLTGLANRTALLDRLEHKLARAERAGREVSVVFLDLDGFKLINDSLGHLAGDELLRLVAARIGGCTRRNDTCARLGGDEFAIVPWEGGSARLVAERVKRALADPFVIEGQEVFVGASVGIATGREEAQALLRNADVAMYHAKRAGLTVPARFEPGMWKARVSRLAGEAELRRAVQDSAFELHYQPIFDLGSGAPAAFEALVRWNHPERGLILPGEFRPLAEDTGMVVDIDRWVLREGCRQFAHWWRTAPLSLGINVTVADLRQPGFAAQVEEAIGGAFPPGALILEIVESAPLAGSPEITRTLHELSELGVRIALDDFGTGYSSLLNLSRLPIDMVKLARQLLDPRGRNPRGLLAGMIDLVRHLEMEAVAEGIETEDEHRLLAELGCQLGQGFLLSRPLCAADAEQILRTAG